MDQETVLLTLLESGLAHCTVSVAGEGGLIASLFLAGVVGSLVHCAGMCGPFVLTQVTARLESVPASQMRDWHRLTGAALVPYHAGRLTTYGLLGAIAALMAGELTQASGLRWVSAGLLAVAAVLFLGYAVPRLTFLLPGTYTFGWSEKVTGFAAPLLRNPSGWRGYGLGLVLGFIPCGLVYAALTAAAATADPIAGAAGMIAFGLGTVPGLLAVGLFGHVAASRWRLAVTRVAPVLMVFNAGVLASLAWRLLA